MKNHEEACTDSDNHSSFRSIFFPAGEAVNLRVPDYQRAFSWEQKQIELFIADLEKYQGGGKGYYFGHFIAEDVGTHREIVDGQQRITTFVLFLMVCQVLSSADAHHSAYAMIRRFSTVSYDEAALKTIGINLVAFINQSAHFIERKPPTDEQIIKGLSIEETFTRSQRRIVLALLRFHQAFQKGVLKHDKIGDYIEAVMTAHCSHHLTRDKSVAVNIFEMHNTRGVPLTTLEIVKAMLMKFVYDYTPDDEARSAKVKQIQDDFGEIYGMEEGVAVKSFRGEMTMDKILKLHLRVVDDGLHLEAVKDDKKTNSDFDFDKPPLNADAAALVKYVSSRLHYHDSAESKEKTSKEGVSYALNLAKELKKSVQIVSKTLPAWDISDSLVGDVLILEQDLSCQFFLLICRRLKGAQGGTDGRVRTDVLLLWEKLLFTRDFHGEYYNLKGGRDDFPKLFASCGVEVEQITEVIKSFLVRGFRPDRTTGLQSIVASYLIRYREDILNQGFNWWKPKMIYAIYKYEISRDEISGGAKVREVMKGTISVEHILPQEWYWIKDSDNGLRGLLNLANK